MRAIAWVLICTILSIDHFHDSWVCMSHVFTSVTIVPSKNSIRASRKERSLTNDAVREQSETVMRRNDRPFDAARRIITKRGRQNVEGRSPTSSSAGCDAMDTRLGAREIPVLFPWWSAFTDLRRFESQQSASRLAGHDGTLLPCLGPGALAHATCRGTIAATEHNGGGFTGPKRSVPTGHGGTDERRQSENA